jgi:predicted metal-binding protein
MSQQHTLLVCTTCAGVWKEGKRVGESGGEKFLCKLQEIHKNWDLQTEFIIQPTECMSACSRACAVSFVANGKYTYLFGDLSPDLSTEEMSTVLECATKYYNHPDGLLPWAERPAPLKKGVLARIPAIG